MASNIESNETSRNGVSAVKTVRSSGKGAVRIRPQ